MIFIFFFYIYTKRWPKKSGEINEYNQVNGVQSDRASQ